MMPIMTRTVSLASLFVALLALVVLAAAPAAAQPATQAPNTLTATEKAAGWRLLFDGASTKGWHVFGRTAVEGWDISDGTLIGTGKGGDILTDEEFENFELAVDWKLSPRGNSGILFNVVEQGYKSAYETGPEYQLIDDEGWPDKLQDWQTTAANYAMHVASRKAARPVGEWNQTRIVVNRGRVEHWLNGVKVVEYQMWTPEWEALVKAGKWKDYPGYGRAKKGRLGLQDHGSRTYFRNIKVRPL